MKTNRRKQIGTRESVSGRGDPRSRCSGARLCAAHRPRPPVAQRSRFLRAHAFKSLARTIGATWEGAWVRRGRMWLTDGPCLLSAACPCKSIYDLHVRTIPRYIADLLVCFVVRLADWPEEMAPKRRMSEKQLHALAANRLNRWHGCPSSQSGSEVMRDDDDDDKERA